MLIIHLKSSGNVSDTVQKSLIEYHVFTILYRCRIYLIYTPVYEGKLKGVIFIE